MVTIAKADAIGSGLYSFRQVPGEGVTSGDGGMLQASTQTFLMVNL